MDPISAVGTIISLPFFLAGGASPRDWLDILTLSGLRDSLSHGRNARLVDAYGLFRTLLLQWAFPDGLDVIHRIEQDVLQGTKAEGAMRTRDAMCAKYNMTAVAAAIIAQVAITALSLPQIDKTHWTVQAAFIVSLVTGCLSVFYCCMIQHSFGTLISPEDVKDWLCKPGKWHGIDDELTSIEHSKLWAPGSESTTTKAEMQALRSKILGQLHSDRWQTPSLNAAIMLVAPVRLLYYAVLLFLSGLGIYLSLLVSKKIEISSGVNASVGTLIFFIVTVGFGLLLFYVPTGLKSFEHIPGQRVKRGADHIKLMLDAYQGLEELETDFQQLRADNATGTEPHSRSEQAHDRISRTYAKLSHTLVMLAFSSMEPSQEALEELLTKLAAVSQRLDSEFGDLTAGIHQPTWMRTTQELREIFQRDSQRRRLPWRHRDLVGYLNKLPGSTKRDVDDSSALSGVQKVLLSAEKDDPVVEERQDSPSPNETPAGKNSKSTDEASPPEISTHPYQDTPLAEALRAMATAQEQNNKALEKLVGFLGILEARLSRLTAPAGTTGASSVPT